MAISLGTPAVFNLVTIDTGSTLSWVQCEECQVWCHDQAPQAEQKFKPDSSTTYSHIGCHNEDCIDLHEVYDVPFDCIEETNTCLYSVRYGSSQYSAGKLGKDRLALGNSDDSILDDLVFGCSEDDMFKGSEAGIIGLGNKSYSFFNQLVRKTSYNAFAYCFPIDHKSEGFLTIGPYPPKLEVATPLIPGYGKRWYAHAYSLLQVGMTIDGKRLDVDPSEFRRQLMIVDSGTDDTFLSSPVYYAMAVSMRDKGYDRVYDASKKTVCFSRSASGGSVNWSGLPKVEMKFLRADLTLPPQNVFHQQSDGRICLAFHPDVAGVAGVQILGNKATRSFRLVYDLQMMTFRFQARAC
ncbi:hypothetical protein PR202_ga03985 [Eleusine coracana subsp. coracana]|uniref:Peptidase A1 domain-containing protein n=1 Tax=Eleusine coracana subsp. coracana TaxID=191504 RepID=A0AAV5BNV1_ELECO|nr:hypothetical protein PR202_ga03985 [Eleusine coracana subsp. coracana]